MNKEEVSIKITTPFFEKAELDLLDSYNETMHNMIEEYTKMYLEDKEKVITQRIIICQQEEINRLNDKIYKAIEYIKSYNLPEDLGHLGEAPISIRELRDLLNILQNGSDDNE